MTFKSSLQFHGSTLYTTLSLMAVIQCLLVVDLSVLFMSSVVEVHAETEPQTNYTTETELRCNPHTPPNSSCSDHQQNSLSDLQTEPTSHTDSSIKTLSIQADCDGYLGCSIRG